MVLGKGGVPLAPTRTPLDRQGNFVSPAAVNLTNQRNLAGHVVLRGPGAEVPPVLGEIIGYRADAESWSKNMEAHELARLLDLAFRRDAEGLADGFVVRLTPTEYAALDGNLRRHFLAVRG